MDLKSFNACNDIFSDYLKYGLFFLALLFSGLFQDLELDSKLFSCLVFVMVLFSLLIGVVT